MTKPTSLPLTDRPSTQRLPLALLLSIAGLFLLGVATGVVVAFLSRGELPPASKLWVLALPFLCIPLGFLALRKAWRLAAPSADASPYERRYRKMWLWVMALGAPIGMFLVVPFREGVRTGPANPFSSTPLPPTVAVVLTIVGLAMITAAIVIYHRTIDEQEERGYLWGSQIAYYFLSLLFPAWWLLQRGGFVPDMTTAGAVVAVLASFIIQAAVWAWFKFR